MANFNIVVDSDFKPFSFDEMLRPYQMYGERYNQISSGMADLDTEASTLEALANEQTDPIAYKQYKDYSQKLKDQANKLAVNGLNPTSMNALTTLKSKYASDIAPIKGAVDRRRMLAEEQRKAMDNDPSLVYERMANEMSLDDFLVDPERTYGQQYSGRKLEEEISKEAANFVRELKGAGYATLQKMGLPYLYNVIHQPGVTSADVLNTIRNHGGNTALRRILDNALDRTGAGRVDANGNNVGKGWASNQGRRALQKYAESGLYSAIGSPKTELYRDEFSFKLNEAKKKAMADYYENRAKLSFNSEISQLSEESLQALERNYEEADSLGILKNPLNPFMQWGGIPTKGGYDTIADFALAVTPGVSLMQVKKSFDKNFVHDAVAKYDKDLASKIDKIKLNGGDSVLRYETKSGNQNVLATKEEVMSQCADEKSKEIAGELYDKFIVPQYLKAYNLGRPESQKMTETQFKQRQFAKVRESMDDIKTNLNNYRLKFKDPNGMAYRSISMNFEGGDNKVLERLLNSSQFGEGQIFEYGGIDYDTGKIAKGKSVNKKKLFKDDGTLKKKYGTRIVFNGDTPYLIAENDSSEDSEKYIISLASKTNTAGAYMGLQSTLNKITKDANKYKQQYGIEYYYKVPVFNNYTQADLDAIDRSYAIEKYWGIVNNDLNNESNTTSNISSTNTKEKKTGSSYTNTSDTD